MPSDMCVQRRLKSACAFVQSDQGLRCPYEEILNPWLSKSRQLKILIRLRECVVSTLFQGQGRRIRAETTLFQRREPVRI